MSGAVWGWVQRLVTGALAVALVSVGPTAEAAAKPDWKGSAHAHPAAYAWLDDQTPQDTYEITLIRGLTKRQVLHRLGHVRRDLGRMTYARATGYYFAHVDQYGEGHPVVQVSRLGHAIVVYQPYGLRALVRISRLSHHARVADFGTDVELDTYVSVARHGKVVRQFDASFRPPKKGALPQEKGLDFGARHENVFATSWAFLERLTLTHISQAWFERPHLTYVLQGR